jgi:hypothetical protein
MMGFRVKEFGIGNADLRFQVSGVRCQKKLVKKLRDLGIEELTERTKSIF